MNHNKYSLFFALAFACLALNPPSYGAKKASHASAVCKIQNKCSDNCIDAYQDNCNQECPTDEAGPACHAMCQVQYENCARKCSDPCGAL
jgi:hypothetical protein